jgi:hypothetical protein
VQLGDKGIEGRTVSCNRLVGRGLGSSASRQRVVASFCGRDNKTLAVT